MPVSSKQAILISKVAYEQIEAFYPLLYQKVFKEADPAHRPGFVYVAQDADGYVGFISAYLHNIETIYIQYGGVLPEYRGYQAFAVLKQALCLIHEEYRFILTLVKNDNTRALKLLMACGFKIIGIRQATDQNLFIELLKEK